MAANDLLYWLGLVSSYYILLPLLLVGLRWRVHDTVRRRVAWYVIFNLSFTVLTRVTAGLFDNIFLFYLASPVYLTLVWRIYDALVKPTQVWRVVSWLIGTYWVFVAIDMIWLENFRVDFSKNIYPVEKSLIVFMAYYFLYQFSRESRADFSSLWIGLGIGINALLSLVSVVYMPYVGGWDDNTIGNFIWNGLGSIITLVSYSFVAYGLWIAKPALVGAAPLPVSARPR
jgi:hypothetical protein